MLYVKKHGNSGRFSSIDIQAYTFDNLVDFCLPRLTVKHGQRRKNKPDGERVGKKESSTFIIVGVILTRAQQQKRTRDCKQI